MKRKLAFLLGLILVVLALCGCAKEASKEQETLADNQYNVYFTNHEKTKLLSHTITIDLEDDSEVINRLCEALKGPKKGTQEVSVFNGIVQLSNYIINDRVLHMYFTDDYYMMDNIAEIMFRSAVVKTVSQVSSIDYVMFYVADQPIKNQSGNLVGLMSANSFINDAEDAMESIKWLDITLYYADSAGKTICGERTQLAYSQITPIERVIVEKLIKGPDFAECRKAIPSDTKVLSVSIKDGVCYVNFDSAFLTGNVDVYADVTIYSIVNSLCELKNVNKVQLMVDGSSDGAYHDTYSLSVPYERNLDIVTEVYNDHN